MNPALDQLLEEALSLCQQAAELTLGWFQSQSLEVEHKGDGSPVTQADREVEDFLRGALAERWPEDAVVGEERPAQPGSSGRTWFIDPIDGTKSFAHGVPLYATLLAMHDEQGPALGVISLPALGEVVYAGRGGGCNVEGLRGGTAGVVSSAPASVSDASLSRVHSFGSSSLSAASSPPVPSSPPAELDPHLPGPPVELDSNLPGPPARRNTVVCMSGMEYIPASARQHLLDSDMILRTWGDAYGYTLLATGRIDAMIDFGMNPWDTAPLAVIVPEAGGIISSWDGGDAMQSSSVVAATPSLHPKLVELLDGAGSPNS